jgi:ABC-2 type transport system ATP-binding protein
MLQLMNVKKFYNKHLILEIPSLELEGGFYWIKGANGSGKTTLLKMTAGLIPFEGDILFRNISLRRNALAYRQHSSWAEAEPLYPPFMTGMNLISLYQRIRKASPDDVYILLDLFDIHHYVNTPVGTYSAGMIKKLSLVLAFLGNPSLIVLDEPLITLDPDAVNALCLYILEKHKTTFLMSSHQVPDNFLLPLCKELTVNNRTISR